MHNRVTLITGASAGIGAATARLLGETDTVVLVARRAERLQAVADAITDAGGRAEVIVADLADPAAPAAVVAEAVARCGGLDVVINNAGRFDLAPTADLSPEHLSDQFGLNLVCPMLLTSAAIPHLAEGGGGWVVNISSVAGEACFTGTGAYSAAKAGLERWTAILREEVREQGIRVGVVRPGATDTEVWPADFQPPKERLARAEDVALAIRHLLTAPPTCAIDELQITPPTGAL